MNRNLRLISVVFLLASFFFSPVNKLRAQYTYECNVCAQHLGGNAIIGPFATEGDCEQSRNNLIAAENLDPSAVSPCQGGGGTGSSASGSDSLDRLAAQVILDPHSTSQQRLVAFSAPLLQGFIEGLFSQPDNSAEIAQEEAREQEAQRQLAIAAELERQRQARLAEEKYQRIKGMLKLISSADSVTLTSLSQAGNDNLKPMFGDSSSDTGLKPLNLDTGNSAPVSGPGGNSALDQLKRAVFFSQQAASASTDEDAKFLSAEAFDPTITQLKETDLPPAVNNVQVSADQAQQYNDLLAKREKDLADYNSMKIAVANIEIDKKSFKAVVAELDKQIAAYNQAVASITPGDTASLAKAQAELERLEKVKAQADEAVKKEALKEKEEKAKEKEDRAASVGDENLMRKYVDGLIIAENPKSPTSGWAQVSMQNNSGIWLYLIVDQGDKCGPAMPGGFCTTHVRPGPHILMAIRSDNGQMFAGPHPQQVPKGTSPTWTVP